MLDILKKRQVKNEVGKWKGFFSRTEWDFIQYPGVWYAGGVESIDNKFNIKTQKPRYINFATYKTEKGLALQLWEGISDSGYICFSDEQIKKIKIVNTEFFKKSMGGMGQGIVGGLLFGGVGLILGAAKGLSEKTSGQEQTTWMMTIQYEGNTESNGVAIEISPKRKEQFVNFLKHHYADKSEFETELDKDVDDKQEVKQSGDSIPDQIKKLSELKDQGILTEEEFQDKKKDLLNKM